MQHINIGINIVGTPRRVGDDPAGVEYELHIRIPQEGFTDTLFCRATDDGRYAFRGEVPDDSGLAQVVKERVVHMLSGGR